MLVIVGNRRRVRVSGDMEMVFQFPCKPKTAKKNNLLIEKHKYKSYPLSKFKNQSDIQPIMPRSSDWHQALSESENHSVMSDPLLHWSSPGQKTRVGSHSLLQGIVPTQGLNPGLPHCRQILYHLRHQGSPM